MSNRNITQRSVRGLSLVELLVAITIGAILLAGAITLFVNNRDTYRTTNDLSRLQETARFAVDMMTKDIRMAGYFGCIENVENVVSNVGAGAGALWDINMNPGAGAIVPPVEGLDDSDITTGWLPSTFAEPATAINSGDGITLRYLSGSLVDNLPSPAVVGCTGNCTPDYEVTAQASGLPPVTVTVDAAADFTNGNLVGISNCRSSDIVQINATALTATTFQTDEPLQGIYDPLAQEFPMVARYVGVRYFIANSLNGTGPALFRTQISDTALTETAPQELFEGVETLQFQYGVDTTGDGRPDAYQTADVVANWLTVVSVRIGILLRTVDERSQTVDTQAFTVLDANIPAANDRRHRRVFTTTVMLRNT